MTATALVTVDTLVARYAADIAFVAEEQPATTVAAFTYQLVAASENFEAAGINGGDDLQAGAQYIADANTATDDNKRTVLLGQAAEYLAQATDMADEYRDAS